MGAIPTLFDIIWVFYTCTRANISIRVYFVVIAVIRFGFFFWFLSSVCFCYFIRLRDFKLIKWTEETKKFSNSIMLAMPVDVKKISFFCFTYYNEFKFDMNRASWIPDVCLKLIWTLEHVGSKKLKSNSLKEKDIRIEFQFLTIE